MFCKKTVFCRTLKKSKQATSYFCKKMFFEKRKSRFWRHVTSSAKKKGKINRQKFITHTSIFLIQCPTMLDLSLYYTLGQLNPCTCDVRFAHSGRILCKDMSMYQKTSSMRDYLLTSDFPKMFFFM